MLRDRHRDERRGLLHRHRGDDERRVRRSGGVEDRDRRPHHGNGERKARDRDDHGSRMVGSRAVACAKAHLADLTGRAAEGVSALQQTRDGWRVVLEIVELQRIPHTTDIMASYAVDLDSRGDLMGYQRVARYYRSDVDGD